MRVALLLADVKTTMRSSLLNTDKAPALATKVVPETQRVARDAEPTMWTLGDHVALDEADPPITVTDVEPVPAAFDGATDEHTVTSVERRDAEVPRTLSTVNTKVHDTPAADKDPSLVTKAVDDCHTVASLPVCPMRHREVLSPPKLIMTA